MAKEHAMVMKKTNFWLAFDEKLKITLVFYIISRDLKIIFVKKSQKSSKFRV